MDDLENRLTDLPNRYTVTVQFTVESESSDDAETEVVNVIQEGILFIIDNENREPLDNYDIIKIEPAEVGF